MLVEAADEHQCGLEECLCGLEVALFRGQHTGSVQRTDAEERIAALIRGECVFERTPPFVEMTVDLPEPPERGAHSQSQIGIALLPDVRLRGAKVVVLALEPSE